jgi:Cu2+-containing amine oxidase
MEDKKDFEMSEEDKLFFFGPGYEGNMEMPKPLDSLDEEELRRGFETLKKTFTNPPERIILAEGPNGPLEKEAYEKWLENYQQERRRIIDEINHLPNHLTETVNSDKKSDLIDEFDKLIDTIEADKVDPKMRAFYQELWERRLNNKSKDNQTPVMDDRDRVINDLLDDRKGTK